MSQEVLTNLAGEERAEAKGEGGHQDVSASAVPYYKPVK